MIEKFIAYPGDIVASFTDVESGKKDERANLLLAIEEVKKVRGVLLVAKLDRLSRRCSLLFMLRESGRRRERGVMWAV